MKRILYFIICIATFSVSCRRDSNYTEMVHERLHGKYKAISSITSEPVDVDKDGATSTDLLSEINYPDFCNLEIRIVDKGLFLFSQMWPEQYIIPGVPPVIDYACQGTGRQFTIADDNTTLLLKPDETALPDPNRWTFPSSVSIEATNTIKVVFTKRLYTAAGEQTVVITTIYQRFTKKT